jgi:protein TonB
MKNLFLLSFLFIVSISFSQVESYENAFFYNDTMKKYSKYEYSKTIREVLKKEFANEINSDNKLKKFENSLISLVIDVDTTGTISVSEVSHNEIFYFLNNTIKKLPKIKPLVGLDNFKYLYSMVMVFKLDSKYEIPIVIEDKNKFESLEKIPRFKNCNPILSNESMKNCFTEKMNNHIKENFSYPKQAIKNNIQGRTIALFTIEKDGTIENITIVEGHPIIQSSTLDLILKLPPFIPGELNGEKTNVSYSQPIFYKLENKKRK